MGIGFYIILGLWLLGCFYVEKHRVIHSYMTEKGRQVVLYLHKLLGRERPPPKIGEVFHVNGKRVVMLESLNEEGTWMFVDAGDAEAKKIKQYLLDEGLIGEGQKGR